MNPDRREREGQYERRDDVEIGFGPFKFRASGRHVTLVVIFLAGIAVVGWHDWKQTNQVNALIETQQAIAYVLTLNEAERKTLKLSMPTSLRQRVEGYVTGMERR